MADPTAGVTTPIIVPDTPTTVQVQAGLRQLILGVSAFLTALGMTGWAGKLAPLLDFTGPVAFLLVFLWGQLHTRAERNRLITAAAAAPNSVAIVQRTGGAPITRALLPLLLVGGALLLAAPMLTACGTTGARPSVGAPVPAVVILHDGQRLDVRKAKDVVHVAEHQILAQRNNLIAGGVLTGPARATAIRLTNRASTLHQARLTVDKATQAVTATDLQAQVDAFFAALDIARAAIPGAH